MRKFVNTIAIASLLASTIGFAQAEAPALPDQAVEHMPVCPPGPAEIARCHVRVATDVKGKPLVTTSPTGLTPAQLHVAYNLPTTTATNQIIAIVDAYDSPTVKSDLDVFSNTFGLPVLPNCVGAISASAVPCFAKLNQNGGTTYPAVNGGWALEISLDVQAAHAICQNCSILLVEGSSNSFADLMTAFDQAAIQGAKIISNSYGSSGEFSGETTFDSHFAGKAGYAMTFSSGDNAYGTSYPAASRYVTAVGGTTLRVDTAGNYISESAWSGAGSGCSALESKPSFQSDTGCAMRTIADVSAVADPATGLSIYDMTPYNGTTGWYKVGGTSLSAPVIAAVYALAGGVPSGVAGNALVYGQSNYLSNMRDVTSGSNGNCSATRGNSRKVSGSPYLCTGVTGYDGPTGLGTPNGTGAF